MHEISAPAFPPSLEDVNFSPVSFMDPNGRVFEWKNRIFRGIFEKERPYFINLLKTDTFSRLLEQGSIIKTSVADFDLDGFGIILEHRKLEVESYCFEWAPEMLKRAALLTLEICESLLEIDSTLLDAYPWNIFFEGIRPTFIDISSISHGHKNYIWIPYQQFCNFFYHPLLLYGAGHYTVARRLLFNYLDGIDSKEVESILSFGSKLRLPGYLSRIALPNALSGSFISKKGEAKLHALGEKLSTSFDNQTRFRFFKSLKATIDKLDVKPKQSHWSDYYVKGDSKLILRKKVLLERVMDRVLTRPGKRVLDLGCNTGEFSVLSAQKGADVVAIDSDETCISLLFETAERETLSIQPLVMDVLNPSPAFGWCGKQFKPASQRFQADLVIAFALIHHLVFKNGQDFLRVIESIKNFQKKQGVALIEFIAKEDVMATRLRKRIQFDDSWYDENNFKKALSICYRKVEKVGSLSDTRCLYLAFNE